MTRSQKALLDRLILLHRGREYAAGTTTLTRALGTTYRELMADVAALVIDHHVLIGSSRQRPAGIFLIETAEEMDAATRPLRSQALAMLKRISVLEGKPQKRILRELLGQLRLEEQGL